MLGNLQLGLANSRKNLRIAMQAADTGQIPIAVCNPVVESEGINESE